MNSKTVTRHFCDYCNRELNPEMIGASLVEHGKPTDMMLCLLNLSLESYSSGFVETCLEQGWSSARLIDAGMGAQCGIAISFENKIAVVAFRGSQTEGWEFLWDWLISDFTSGIPAGGSNFPDGVKCGLGFRFQADRIASSVDGAVGNLVRSPEWRVILTGHSLGGALCQVLGMGFSEMYGTPRAVEVYPIEPPRTWNRKGQKHIRWMIEQGGVWSAVINTKHGTADLVTRLPCWMKHGANLIVLGKERLYEGQGAVRAWNQAKGRKASGLPGWRIISRAIEWLWRRARNGVASHLGQEIVDKIHKLRKVKCSWQ